MKQDLLEAPLDPAAIKKRKQGSVQLSYIEGYYAINKANEIFGYGGWSKHVDELKVVESTEREIKGRTRYDVYYISRVSIVASDSNFEDVGYGNGSSYAGFGEAHELAAKEAVTDAMKRCLRHFGDQFANCLYDKGYKPGKVSASTPEKAPSKPSKPSKAEEAPSAQAEDDKDSEALSQLPKMTESQRKRMGKIWKFVDDNLNKDGSIDPEDIACATYACLTRWPDSVSDEEHVINTISIKPGA